MGWKCYANASMPMAQVRTYTAEKLSEIFGSCVAISSGVTLSYGGNDYYVEISCSTNRTNYVNMLFVNDETGEFIVAWQKTGLTDSDSKRDQFIYGALLKIQTEENKTELIPCVGGETYYARVFGMEYNSGVSGDYNETSFVTLTPLATGGRYNSTVSHSNFRPIVGMFTSNVSNIPVGATIEVAGQQFLCVSCGMFAKL